MSDVSVQPEHDFELHEDWHRNALTRRRVEEPLLHGFDRFLIEAVLRVERLNHTYVTNRAVGLHDGFEHDHALNLGAHGFARVLRLGELELGRIDDAVAGLVGAAAESAPGAVAD